jgi:hypothetical protein
VGFLNCVITARNMCSLLQKVHKLVPGRFKALELAVKKVLRQSDAAEFLVAFAGIQDVIHQLAAKQKLPKGPAILPALAFGPA